jgi:RNA polymerase sigma factor (sigma-70 family)
MKDGLEENDQRRKSLDLSATSTEILVRQAKDGDRNSLWCVIKRYYDCWLKKYHGQLGVAIRRIYDTEDLVQSAIVDVIEGLPQLKNEAAFFSWVTSIIRHKLAKKYRDGLREVRLEGWPGQPEPIATEARPEKRVLEAESYIRTLEAFIRLFPRYPEPMAAAYLRLLEDCSIEELEARFRCSRRTVFRWAKEGMDLLREHLLS